MQDLDAIAHDERHFLGYLHARMSAAWSDQPALMMRWTLYLQTLLRQLDPWERVDPFRLAGDQEVSNGSNVPATEWCRNPRTCPATFRGWDQLVRDASRLRTHIPLLPGDGLFGCELEHEGKLLANQLVSALLANEDKNTILISDLLDVEKRLKRAFTEALKVHPGYQAVRLYVRCHRACHAAQAPLPAWMDEPYEDASYGCTVHASESTFARVSRPDGSTLRQSSHKAWSLCDPLMNHVWKELSRGQRLADQQAHARELFMQEERRAKLTNGSKMTLRPRPPSVTQKQREDAKRKASASATARLSPVKKLRLGLIANKLS
jgi:hypothetical protein